MARSPDDPVSRSASTSRPDRSVTAVITQAPLDIAISSPVGGAAGLPVTAPVAVARRRVADRRSRIIDRRWHEDPWPVVETKADARTAPISSISWVLSIPLRSAIPLVAPVLSFLAMIPAFAAAIVDVCHLADLNIAAYLFAVGQGRGGSCRSGTLYRHYQQRCGSHGETDESKRLHLKASIQRLSQYGYRFMNPT